MMQDVEPPDQTGEKFLMLHRLQASRNGSIIEFRYREPSLGKVVVSRNALNPTQGNHLFGKGKPVASEADRDPRHRTQKMQKRLQEMIDDLRAGRRQG